MKTRSGRRNLQDGLACRVDDSAAPHVFATAFGPVETPLAQGVFSPAKDEVVCTSGEIIRRYYKDRLGFKHFKPLDKSVFTLPLTGWLTWMYYGRDVTPEEVLVNARWIAEHLREYGVKVILIDDGWEGDGRDWERTRASFPQGMKWLADEIKKLGLTPGLWLCPHGQDNQAFVEKEGCFISCGGMGGPYSVDPTHPKAKAYIHHLIRRITREWGYRYLKFDGISASKGYGVLSGYRENQKQFKDTSVSADDAYRRFFGAICESGGKKVFINGCSVGVCPEVLGLCHSMRTGADTDANWDNGFMRAVTATMNGYHLHSLAVYSDPDCCLVRPPLSLDMARAWVTLYGVTGQLIMFDDRMPDLGPDRVALIKKIAPTGPVRPMDLFPARRVKDLFDLKVNHQGRTYDVVACFNYEMQSAAVTHVRFQDLGLDPAAPYHVFDFWSQDYLGLCTAGVFVNVPPTACRLLTICPAGDFPVLLSTDRHVLQGWPDLQSFAVNRATGTLRGTSAVIKGEPYTLTFGLPNDGQTAFEVSRVKVTGVPRPAVTQGRGVARVRFVPGKSGKVNWSVTVRRIPMPKPIPIGAYPYMMGARDVDPWTMEVFWVSFSSPAGFVVSMDGQKLGHVFDSRVRVGGLAPGSRHEFEVSAADLDGRVSARSSRFAVSVGETLPGWLNLSDLQWTEASTGYLAVRKDQSAGGASLSVGGRRYRTGIGTHPVSRVVYDLQGLFLRLRGSFGIEDQNGIPADKPHAESGRALFEIRGDGRTLLEPRLCIHGDPAVPLDIDVSGVNRLELLVTKPEDGGANLAAHSDWLDMEAQRAEIKGTK